MSDLVALRFDTRGWDKLAVKFAGLPAKIARVQKEAAIEGGMKVQTDLRRNLGRIMGVKYGIMTKVVTSSYQGGGRFVMYVRSPYDMKLYGPTLPITLFGARGGGGGVSAAPWGRSRTFKRSFVVTKTANASLVLPFRARLGQDRRPVRRIFGPNPAKELLKAPMPLVFQMSVRAQVGPVIEKRLARAFA